MSRGTDPHSDSSCICKTTIDTIYIDTVSTLPQVYAMALALTVVRFLRQAQRLTNIFREVLRKLGVPFEELTEKGRAARARQAQAAAGW